MSSHRPKRPETPIAPDPMIPAMPDQPATGALPASFPAYVVDKP